MMSRVSSKARELFVRFVLTALRADQKNLVILASLFLRVSDRVAAFTRALRNVLELHFYRYRL